MREKKKRTSDWFIFIANFNVVLDYVQQELEYCVCEVNINVKLF